MIVSRQLVLRSGLLAICTCAGAANVLAQPGVPPVPVPQANPITESKRVLGKILFWDEQLSSDNTMSCGSCHRPGNGGSDPNHTATPGLDGSLGTPDDVFGSPGVISADANGDYLRSVLFEMRPQVTGRAAPSAINAAFAPLLFWDGRASGTFIDPQTGQVAIQNGGGLESQVIGPPVSSVEMAHADRDWNAVSSKIAAARPLAAATDLPADVAAALADNPSYPELFRRAFGNDTVTGRRIAFAIATYERTLVSNQSPFDRFLAGQQNAMTPLEQQGSQVFQNSQCVVCHGGPLQTGQGFRNIGLRPPGEDLGRQIVTGNPADRGRFKVPSLRNVGLRSRFMHNGQFTTLAQVIDFYARAPGAAPQFPDNRDPVMLAVNVPPPARPALQAFLQNALTDPRVAAEEFPFDRPTLFTERGEDVPVILDGGTPGASGVPRIIAVTPAFIGNADFKIGLDGANPGATAMLAVSPSEPINGRINFLQEQRGPVQVGADGVATAHLPIVPGDYEEGQVFYAQWIVEDPGAPTGQALSTVARVRVFCGSTGCAPVCAADWNHDAAADSQDYFDYMEAFFDGEADFNGADGTDSQDFFDFLASFFAGC